MLRQTPGQEGKARNIVKSGPQRRFVKLRDEKREGTSIILTQRINPLNQQGVNGVDWHKRYGDNNAVARTALRGSVKRRRFPYPNQKSVHGPCDTTRPR
jgi:hypothetical protein